MANSETCCGRCGSRCCGSNAICSCRPWWRRAGDKLASKLLHVLPCADPTPCGRFRLRRRLRISERACEPTALAKHISRAKAAGLEKKELRVYEVCLEMQENSFAEETDFARLEEALRRGERQGLTSEKCPSLLLASTRLMLERQRITSGRRQQKKANHGLTGHGQPFTLASPADAAFALGLENARKLRLLPRLPEPLEEALETYPNVTGGHKARSSSPLSKSSSRGGGLGLQAPSNTSLLGKRVKVLLPEAAITDKPSQKQL